jgi:hypothetical protein
VKVGDLVKIRESQRWRKRSGKIGIITETCIRSRDNSHRPLLTVTFPDGDELFGITQAWVTLLNESR